VTVQPVPYEEEGRVYLELELESGQVVQTEVLRVWTPTPYANKGSLLPPRNEAVSLTWVNGGGLEIKRVRAVWSIKKGFNQG
jgi:hypothetical protein